MSPSSLIVIVSLTRCLSHSWTIFLSHTRCLSLPLLVVSLPPFFSSFIHVLTRCSSHHLYVVSLSSFYLSPPPFLPRCPLCTCSSLSLSLTLSFSPSRNGSLSLFPSLTRCVSLPYSLSFSLVLSPPLPSFRSFSLIPRSRSHSLYHSLTHSLSLFFTRCPPHSLSLSLAVLFSLPRDGSLSLLLSDSHCFSLSPLLVILRTLGHEPQSHMRSRE